MNFYLHIPFCRQKCPYCKFALTPTFDEIKKKRYLAHLKKEIKNYFREQNPSNKVNRERNGTIYFGGGTPSILTLEEVEDLLECILEENPPNFPGKEGIREISFECNPEDITKEYIIGLLELGINRISLGVQSLNDSTLEKIHRNSKESIFEALDSLRAVLEVTNPKKISINIDLILGLPSSRKGETLESIISLHKKYPFITHTSVYMLEDGIYPNEWKKDSLNEEEIEDEYREICEHFQDLGWHHYEISNWAKPGYECQHNQGYWNHANYRGFGLSATSYEDEKRWENSASFSGYYRGEQSYRESLTKDELDLEKLIYELRTFSLCDTGIQEDKITKFEQLGLLERREGKILLTPAGIFRENFILSELIGKIGIKKV